MPVPKGPPAAMSMPDRWPKRENALSGWIKAAGGGRYDRIVRMIEESEKAEIHSRGQNVPLADRLVPYTLGGTA